MNLPHTYLVVSLLAVSVCRSSFLQAAPEAAAPAWFKDSAAKLESELGTKYGESQRARLQRGLDQVAKFWEPADGDAKVLEDFVRRYFAGTPTAVDATFDRFQHQLEQFDGHFSELRYELKKPIDLDTGAVQPFDELFAAYEPNAHFARRLVSQQARLCRAAQFPVDDTGSAAR